MTSSLNSFDRELINLESALWDKEAEIRLAEDIIGQLTDIQSLLSEEQRPTVGPHVAKAIESAEKDLAEIEKQLEEATDEYNAALRRRGFQSEDQWHMELERRLSVVELD